MRGTTNASAPTDLRGLPAFWVRDPFLRAGCWFVLAGSTALPHPIPAACVTVEAA